MKRFSLSRTSLGVKLCDLTSVSVGVLLLVLTLIQSQNASRQLESLAMDDMVNQVQGITEMASMFNATLTQEVGNYTQLFVSFLPKRFSRDETSRIQVGEFSTPTLRAGLKTLNLDQIAVDDFTDRTSAVATIFVRDGDNFIRVSTSLKKEDGSRAIGTQLDRTSGAWKKVTQGEIYRGLATLFGHRYITQYQPVKDDSGTVIAIIFVGVQIDKQYGLMREKVLARRLGDSGHFYVLNGTPGAMQGQYLFDKQAEGKRPDWQEGVLNAMLTQPEGVQQADIDGETKMLAWQQLPGWNWIVVGEVNRDSLLAPVIHSRNMFLITGLILVLLFAPCFVWYSRRAITRPLQQVIHLAEQYAAGNLLVHLATTRHDEVGQLINAINGIGEGLEKIVAQVRRAAQEISDGTDTIAASSHNISEQIGRQASSVEETSASMEQFGATVEHTADSLRQAMSLVAEASSIVDNGNQTVTRSVNTMSAINVSSQSIADITHVIESIAFQTNILALNAAVEAARAGEHGRGFAVVAAEVRALAQRSAQAAKEIDTLIATSIRHVAEGHALSEQTRDAMSEIVTHIEQVQALMGEINVAAQQQTAGIGLVNLAMNQISQATHQNSELVTQAEQTAQSLSDKGHHLTQLVSVFSIKS
ncbi:methyl-accepting chemotaxis protein [Pantoea stewartii]|uniref:Methyl-accepting chemotaxis protein n=1 Tax=Pantoea stewartii subsp. stewartii DC283 TaxID=660596 RepID=H3RHG4_PANSE|nr:methyl-accepting chemotaxis protein [Pantoea stewartii]ARF51630.1 methyl-accepting chemotaxis protein [Pantoea stewartii subsp. stewartii DC283]EHT99135.1 methyl-accepting chemotaxis protein [Pantoea stewartii subsp. stewartii DC283]KAB0556541.1 HAMP domain-containing protein [Pantoea stewartii subsp. stewartii]